MNFFEVNIENGYAVGEQSLRIAIPEGQLKVLRAKGYEGKKVTLGIRPEDIHAEEVALQTFPDAVIDATVEVSELLGSESMLYSRTGTTDFIAKVNSRDYHEPGDKLKMAFEMTKAHYFDDETEEAII